VGRQTHHEEYEMATTESNARFGNIAWVVAFGLASSSWCLSASAKLGPTFDETYYVMIGLDNWRTGSPNQAMSAGVMPLPTDVQTLPIYLSECYRGRPYDPIADMPEVLPWARIASLIFWWALLIYAFRWGAAFGGRWGGRWATAFVATDPNFLGHATLAATDIAMTATVLIAVYHFYAGRERGPWMRVVLPGVLYGVALSAKASSLPFVPMLFTVVGMHKLLVAGSIPRPTRQIWATIRAWRTATRRLRWDLCYTFGIAIAWVLLYTGSDWKPEPQFAAWAPTLAPGTGRDILVWLAEHGTAGFPNALEGLGRQVKHGTYGNGGVFFCGRLYDQPQWAYYPVTLAMKLPDSTFVLLAFAALFYRSLRRSPTAWVVLILLLFSLTTRVQTGVRIVFPLVAFLHITLGIALASAEPATIRRRLAFALGFAAIVYSAGLSLSSWPDGIRFMNQTWGGPDRGAALLADSNYDWGQGLPELQEWHAANGEPVLFIWFYGSDPRQILPPFRHLAIHNLPDNSEAAVRSIVGEGYLSVSVSLLNAYPDRRPQTLKTIEWLKSLTPAARTRTAFIYKLK